MVITFGLDISHHQPLSLDLAQARRDGCELAVLKAGEGSSYVDPAFAPNLAEARAAGMLVAAYWYQRSNATAQAHVDKIRQVVPRDVPIIMDVEANSGNVDLTRDIVNRLRGAGYKVPLLYLPRWYWQQIGAPSLVGLPPLWSSRYPDNVVGTLAAEWDSVPARFWDGYGGLSVALLQFTSSARIAGYAPLDANAFRGTRQELAALLGASATAAEDDMYEADDRNRSIWMEQALRTLVNQFTGNPNGDPAFGADMKWSAGPKLPGFPSYVDPKVTLTPVDFIRANDEHLNQLLAKVNALTTLVANQSGVTADDIAAALRTGLSADLAPILHDALTDALGSDNTDTAEKVATTVLAKLGEALAPKES